MSKSKRTLNKRKKSNSKVKNNFVKKHMDSFNKPSIIPDKKKEEELKSKCVPQIIPIKDFLANYD